MAIEMNFSALQANLRMLDKQGELAFEQARMNGTLTAEQEKFAAIISDESFVDKFFAADSAEEVQLLFKENGLEVSIDEVVAFGKYIATTGKMLIENGGELSEDDLEQIAGGWSGDDAATGAGVGLMGGGVVGTFIYPGLGSIIGIFAGAAGGTVVGGFAQEIKSTAKLVGSAVKKLGKFISSWF